MGKGTTRDEMKKSTGKKDRPSTALAFIILSLAIYLTFGQQPENRWFRSSFSTSTIAPQDARTTVS